MQHCAPGPAQPARSLLHGVIGVIALMVLMTASKVGRSRPKNVSRWNLLNLKPTRLQELSLKVHPSYSVDTWLTRDSLLPVNCCPSELVTRDKFPAPPMLASSSVTNNDPGIVTTWQLVWRLSSHRRGRAPHIISRARGTHYLMTTTFYHEIKMDWVLTIILIYLKVNHPNTAMALDILTA